MNGMLSNVIKDYANTLYAVNPVAQAIRLTKHTSDSITGGDPRYAHIRLLGGSDITDADAKAHILNKYIDYGTGLAGYKDETMDGYVPRSDAVDGYHYRSGKDFGNLATGNRLPLGGIPAALGGYAYQNLVGLTDGTVGRNASLQAYDNMMGLIGSGKAPAVKYLYDVGSNLHGLFSRSKP
jgi:hypothetical protein|tara:strand:+ start:2361 stop:2903 length:543 start_codon:yes stop_codon:yes gene_type:complete